MTTGANEKKPLFDLCADHAVLDFVNSLRNRFRKEGTGEWLESYDDLLRFAEGTKLISPHQARRLAQAVQPDAGARALLSARELREAIAGIGYAAVDGQTSKPSDVRILERHFQSASQHRELQWRRSGRANNGHARLSWDWGRFETDANLPVWVLAEEALTLLMSDQMALVKACEADTCRWLFLDTSKNHTRRWCMMSICGNRAKARRFRAHSAG